MAEKERSPEHDHHDPRSPAEEATSRPERIPLYRQVWDPVGLTPDVVSHAYAGSGTDEDPFIVTWIPADPRNPMLYSATTRWSIMMVVAMCALMVSYLVRRPCNGHGTG